MLALQYYDPFDIFEKGFLDFWSFRKLGLTDVFEDKDKITLEMELPGVDQNDISITLDKNILKIEGKKVALKDKNYLKLERSTGYFVRQFTILNEIDPEKISATYNKGILSILLPKIPEKGPKQIEIKNIV